MTALVKAAELLKDSKDTSPATLTFFFPCLIN